jgi:hypothetical protein
MLLDPNPEYEGLLEAMTVVHERTVERMNG